MDIEIRCKSFEAEGDYNSSVSLKLSKIDFGGNTKADYEKFLKEWYGVSEISLIYDSSEIVEGYDESELLESIADDNIADWTTASINIDNIEEFVDAGVLAQYVRHIKINTILNE